MLAKDKAQRIAANIAKLPELLRGSSGFDPDHRAKRYMYCCISPGRIPLQGRSFEQLLRTALTASLILAAMVGTVTGGRLDVDINIYPWSSIGKIGIASMTIRHACSGAVIGSNEFLTAAHCLYNDTTKRFFPAGSIHFLLGYARREYRAHRVASRYSYPPDREKLLIGARYDWAIVYVNEPFPTDVMPLRLATATPSPGTAVKIAGYPIDRPHMITADLHCRVFRDIH